MVVYGDDSKDENWGMSRLVEVPQIKPRMECFRISGSGAASIALGSTDATLVDNGTGDYSLTWTKAFAREPVVIVTAKAGRAQVHSTATTTAARVLSFNAAGSATDDDINVLVIGYDYVTEV
jgi:carbon monoxide dehydrogenase subunit G